jgi:hypothetical protein
MSRNTRKQGLKHKSTYFSQKCEEYIYHIEIHPYVLLIRVIRRKLQPIDKLYREQTPLRLYTAFNLQLRLHRRRWWQRLGSCDVIHGYGVGGLFKTEERFISRLYTSKTDYFWTNAWRCTNQSRYKCSVLSRNSALSSAPVAPLCTDFPTVGRCRSSVYVKKQFRLQGCA